MLPLQPLGKRDFVLMDEVSTFLSSCFIYHDHLSGILVLGKKNSTLLKQLPNRSMSVARGVVMPCLILRWRTCPVLARDITSWKDMGGRERAGCLDAMKKKDLILRGDQDHARSQLSAVLKKYSMPMRDSAKYEIRWRLKCQAWKRKVPANLALGRGTEGPSLFARDILSELDCDE